ncbi:L-threonine 3-dehydrogenase-like [Rhopilema esculentum]|uniref:L-threonine 3-dehydrogenase-like n=1 Tax=Rhopilema esculentum TaxID=499914 RepID=UPI0031CE76D6|eukprot:gene16492-7909_t
MAATRIVYRIFAGSKPKTVVEKIKIPELKDGEILGKMLAATICGSDLHTLTGKRIEANPSVLGHEGVIEIVENKRGGSLLGKGDRATFHIADCCKKCILCKSGVEQKCKKLFKYGHTQIGHRSTELSGCYASHIILLPGTHVVKLPDNIPNKIAAPLNCALATMVNAISYSNPSMKSSALVQGAGLLGLYGCVLLKEKGFDKVYCSEVNTARLSLVEHFGGIPIGPTYPTKLEDESVDLVVEVCGVPSVFKEGIQVLRPGGVYALVGMVHPNSKLDITAEQIIRKCITITGVHNYSSKHLDEAVELLSRTIDKYPFSKLLSPSYALSQFDDAVEEALSQSYLRVVIEAAQE